jgi:GT2 family glycosyltransferase
MNPVLSVVVPTFARSAKLGACVASLARQSLSFERYEVLVALDGPDPASVEAATRVWDGPDECLVIDVAPHSGPSATRNRVTNRARGKYVLYLNDDVVPAATLLEVHLREQEAASARGREALIVGAAPWKRWTNECLFDRLVRETSMVFFYNHMDTPESRAQPMKDWGYRHAWSLNLSAPTAMVQDVGGFTVFPQPFYGYEDIELAYRLAERFKTPVLYRPEARVEHDHRMDPAEYLRREYTIGHEALTFARMRPECAQSLFGRDVTSRSEADYCREFVERERPMAQRLKATFEAAALLSPELFSGEHGPIVRQAFYEQHLPLKRWTWRAGLLDAIAGKALKPANADALWTSRLAA